MGPFASASLARVILSCALALAVLTTPAAAGDTGSSRTSEPPDDPANPVEVAPKPTAPRYKPHIMGLSRYLKAARAGKSDVVSPRQVDCPPCDPVGVYEPSHFHESLEIDNSWMPLEPGQQLVLQGVANRGGGLLPHLVIFTVTDLIKEINGIKCRVVWDQDINEGVLSESELAFFAQGDEGAVWNPGEYPEEYFEGQFIGAENTWIHGIENARAGVHVEKRPVIGVGYEQANAPENDFWDCAEPQSIVEMEPELCTPGGCFEDVMTVHEWAPLDGCDVIQVKTYARGVGIVMVGAIGDPEGETLVLQQINELDEDEMDAAREAALALDSHGYEVNEIYAQTLPAYRERSCDDDDEEEEDDDLKTGGTGPMAAQSTGRTFLSIAQNPVRTSTDVSFGVAQTGRAELGIFDVLGRKVRTLVSEVKAAGRHTLHWDGRDDAGSQLARGVYFARLQTGSQVVKQTLVVAH